MYKKIYFNLEKLPSHLRLTEKEIKRIVKEKVKKIKNYFRKSKFQKAIIGVSGGVDSALSTVLTVKALGPKNVYLIHLPYLKVTPQNSFEHIKKLAKNLKIPKKNLILIPINKIIDANWKILKRFKGGNEKIRKGNLMARERMKILFDLSLAKKTIVVGSEDKSEYKLGYYTLWGDQASGIEPIKDLWKTQVHQIAKSLKEIPDEILAKIPSPDLWKGQQAEKEMGFSYFQADIVLSAKEELKMSENEIERNFKIPKKKIEKILKRLEIGKIKALLPIEL